MTSRGGGIDNYRAVVVQTTRDYEPLASHWPSTTSLTQFGMRLGGGGSHTVKNIRRISTHISWRVFHILTEPLPLTFVSVNRRNNEARTHTAMCTGPALRCSVDLRFR